MTIAKLDICNRALTRCGQEPIATLADTNKRALLVVAQYEATLKETLNDTPWNFATTRVRLTRTTDPLFGFAHAYTIPANTVRILSINKEDDFRVEGTTVVTNYDDQVALVTITRVGTVATVAHTGHGFTDGTSVNISGATQTEYNGTKTITFIDADHYSYIVSGTPATPATGTIYATRETSVLYAKIIKYESDESVWSASFIKAFYLKLAEDITYSLVQSSALQQSIIAEAERYLRRARSYNSQEGTPESRYPDDYTTSLRL